MGIVLAFLVTFVLILGLVSVAISQLLRTLGVLRSVSIASCTTILAAELAILFALSPTLLGNAS